MNKLINKPKQTQKSFSCVITERTLDQGQCKKGFQINFCHFHFQFLFRVYICLLTKTHLILLLHCIYTQKCTFESCFLMILQKKTQTLAYTIFFFEEPRNQLFLWKNVNVPYQKKMQLEWNVLLLLHTESSLCKQLVYSI